MNEQTASPETQNSTPVTITAQEFATRFGNGMSAHMVRNLIKNGRLKGFQLSTRAPGERSAGRYMVLTTELQDFPVREAERQFNQKLTNQG